MYVIQSCESKRFVRGWNIGSDGGDEYAIQWVTCLWVTSTTNINRLQKIE